MEVVTIDEEAFGEKPTHETKGSYVPRTDTLYFFAGSLDSVENHNEALRHEILVRKGLGMVEPARLKQFFDSFPYGEKNSKELGGNRGYVGRVEECRSS